MKKFLLFILTFTFSFSYSQLSTRTIEVKDGQMSKFIEMAGKKTKKFNNEDGTARFWTYEILTDLMQVKYGECKLRLLKCEIIGI